MEQERRILRERSGDFRVARRGQSTDKQSARPALDYPFQALFAAEVTPRPAHDGAVISRRGSPSPHGRGLIFRGESAGPHELDFRISSFDFPVSIFQFPFSSFRFLILFYGLDA